jgi:hypothetical protein
MFNEGRSEDYTPITVIGRLPVYLTELIVGLHLLSMVIASLWSGFFANNAWGQALIFDPNLVLGSGHFWRLISYVMLDFPPAGFGAVIWFLIGLAMLWWCGRQLEQFYGRMNLLKSYLLLSAVPAVAALIPGLQWQMAGPELVHFGIFIMFAATFPGIELMFRIPAKWLAWAFLFFNTLVYFSNRHMPGMATLWITALTAYALTRALGRGEWLPQRLQEMLPTLGKPKFTVVKPAAREASSSRDDPVSSIDPILEKIARHGLSSLSAKEHAALKAASGELQKKRSR